jgi:hypothetical protein
MHLPRLYDGLVTPDNMFDIAGTAFASWPADTYLIFETRLWHTTGRNVAKEGERPVILQLYVRHIVRPQENFTLSVAPEVESNLSDAARQAMGYTVTATLCGLEGFKLDETLVRRAGKSGRGVEGRTGQNLRVRSGDVGRGISRLLSLREGHSIYGT